jgi:hypothetical protein
MKPAPGKQRGRSSVIAASRPKLDSPGNPDSPVTLSGPGIRVFDRDKRPTNADAGQRTLFQRTGSPAPLFVSPPPGVRAAAGRVFSSRVRHYERSNDFFARPIPRDLKWSLRSGNDAFVALRYLHEDRNSETKFVLGDFHHLVRTVILRRYPQWAVIVHAPAQHIG